MRELTSTLLAAQKQAASTPFVKVEARNLAAGVVRLDWSRLYAGSEDDYYHAAAIPGDGSLIRARVTLPADSRKLYRQRVTSPGPASDFSQWTYTGQYNCVAVACAALGAEVSIFWTNTSREVRRIKSTDNGAAWGSPELIDYSPTTAINGLAAAYKPNGDLAIFFADQSTLYIKKLVGGQWQAKAAWDKTTGDLSGLACVYDGDWDLLVTGQDTAGDFKLWALAYGDGGDVAAGTWSELQELASAPSDGNFEYSSPFIARPDVFRCFFVESFGGSQAYDRPFWSHTVPGTSFIADLWREPVPFDLSSQYGLALAHDSDYCWLSSPSGVWRASLAAQTLDLTADVVGARLEQGPVSGELTVELRNDDGRYDSPGEGGLATLDNGCQVDFSPGYVTASGNEASAGQSFSLEACEHFSAPGGASLVLGGRAGWGAVASWRARHQSRWNKDSDQASVRDILAFVLARAGLKLETVSASATFTGFYPDFTISPGDGGDNVIARLLSFVPDVLLMEGNKAHAINPLDSDISVYSYGGDHQVKEGRYRRSAWATNRLQVEGYDSTGGQPVIADSFAWEEIGRHGDRLRQVQDDNIGTVSGAQQRGQAHLRTAEMESSRGVIIAPVNCGQQLYDVIDVTDARAGLSAARRRVLGLELVYRARRGEYFQRLRLGAV
ncbi:MAG: hypothetical protein HYX91_04825 [Chloroflexi bacterium]|nr:hypothetical protein [Chloroflexota bacterium]